MTREEWNDLQDFYVAGGKAVVAWLEAVEARRQRLPGVPRWRIEHRLKDWESIAGKLARKRKQRPGYSVADMTDLFGVRVIVESAACARSLSRLVEDTQPFQVHTTEDFLEQARPDGYRGVHFVFRVPPRLPGRRGRSAPSTVAVECQVRTILQHQWSVLSHSEFYKHLGEIPGGLLARMRALSEILECAEVESEELRRGRVLDESLDLLRFRMRGSVIERLSDGRTDGRGIGIQALYLLEIEQQLRRTLVSDGDTQARGMETLEGLVGRGCPEELDTGTRGDLAEMLRQVRAVVQPLGG